MLLSGTVVAATVQAGDGEQLCKPAVLCPCCLCRSSDKAASSSKGLYPVTGLIASCSSSHRLTNITNRCWREGDVARPPPPPPQTPTASFLISGQVELHDGPWARQMHPHTQACDKSICRDETVTKAVSSWLGPVLKHTLKSSGIKQDVWLKHTVLDCKVCHTCD